MILRLDYTQHMIPAVHYTFAVLVGLECVQYWTESHTSANAVRQYKSFWRDEITDEYLFQRRFRPDFKSPNDAIHGSQ